MTVSPRSIRRRLLPLLALLPAACAASGNQFPPACPALSLLRDADRVTHFAGSGRDAVDMVLHAKIAAVPAHCERDGASRVRATINVEADVTRGPAGLAAARDPAAAQATYTVALLDGERVVQQQDFTLQASFADNADAATATGEAIELVMPVTPEKTAAAYHIYVGFRLTPDELAYNRAHPTP